MRKYSDCSEFKSVDEQYILLLGTYIMFGIELLIKVVSVINSKYRFNETHVE